MEESRYKKDNPVLLSIESGNVKQLPLFNNGKDSV